MLQAFWPSIVMKKWLNIKPKVYDFSEDEVDTETESEDDGLYRYSMFVILVHFLFSYVADVFVFFDSAFSLFS